MSTDRPLFIGTSGWSYRHWKDRFFAGVPQRRWLEHLTRHFTGVEINATFYRHMAPTAYAGWRDRTPDDFAIAIKGHRHITHNKKIKDVHSEINILNKESSSLGERLRVVFWQLPPGLHADQGRLAAFLEALALWPGVRHGIEFRHPSWFTAGTASLLETHRVANVISDAGKWPLWPAVTTDLAYVRLHGQERTYASAYGEDGLRPWADKVEDWRREGLEVHVYFDNDFDCAAPYDAFRLMEMVGASPLPPPPAPPA